MKWTQARFINPIQGENFLTTISSQTLQGASKGEHMRDYTYIEGYRFIILNIYRSKRFDVDRLDINFADKDKPEFVRGLRVVDHNESETYLVHGEDADNLSYSLCFLHHENTENKPDYFDEYLIQATSNKEYLVQKLFKDEKPAIAAVH